MYKFIVPADGNRTSSPSKFFKFFIANTQQVRTQEELHTKGVDIVMREDVFCEEGGMIQAARKHSRQLTSQNAQIGRGVLGGHLQSPGPQYGHVLPMAELSGLNNSKKERLLLRGVRLLPSRSFIFISWVWEEGKISKKKH